MPQSSGFATVSGMGRWAWGATAWMSSWQGGMECRLAPGARLFLNASDELGKAGPRENITTGLRFRL